MSYVAALFQTQTVTLFPDVTVDEYGDYTDNGDGVEILCEMKHGSDAVRDASGTEFVPAYVIYTTNPAADGMIDKPIYLIPLADATATTKLYKVRAVHRYPALTGMGGDDWVIYV